MTLTARNLSGGASLSSGVFTGTLPIANGGTGTTSGALGVTSGSGLGTNHSLFRAAWDDTASAVGGRHAFEDVGTYVSPTTGNAGFAATATVSPASGTLPHRNAFQVNEACGGAGTIASYAGLSITAPSGVGVITSYYGVVASDSAGRGTSSYFLYLAPSTGKYNQRDRTFLGPLSVGGESLGSYVGFDGQTSGAGGPRSNQLEVRGAEQAAFISHALSNLTVFSRGVPADAGSPTYATTGIGYGGSIGLGFFGSSADQATTQIGVVMKAAKINGTNDDTGSALAIILNDNGGDNFGQKVTPNTHCKDLRCARRQTTDGNATTAISVDVTVSSPPLTTNTLLVRAYVRARCTVGTHAGHGAAYVLSAAVKNVAGTATLIGTATQDLVKEDDAGTDALLKVTGGTIYVEVTGEASHTYEWVVTLEMYYSHDITGG